MSKLGKEVVGIMGGIIRCDNASVKEKIDACKMILQEASWGSQEWLDAIDALKKISNDSVVSTKERLRACSTLLRWTEIVEEVTA